MICSFWEWSAVLENQNFEKMKKVSGDVIFLHMCIKNHDHMYASWDIECNRHNFLLFCVTFCPFTPLLTPKIKIWKKCKKKTLEILSFSTCVPQMNIIWCDVWFLRYKARWIEFFVTLGHFLPSDPPKYLKKKNRQEMLSFYTCIAQTNIMCIVPAISSATDRIYCTFGPFSALGRGYPLQLRKSKFWKNEKEAWTYHITQVNHKCMMYGSWDMKHERQIFSSFWAIFCLITLLTTHKIKILKK